MDFKNLKANMEKMTLPELKMFADSQGVRIHHKAKPETIIKQVMDKVANPVQQPNTPKVREEEITALMAKRLKDAEESANNTIEMVEAAIAHIKQKKPEFKSEYSREDNSWTFTYKGAQDCGNIAIPLRRIVRQAELVARGKIALMGLNDHFDKTTASGLSAYTNTVLVG